MKKAEDLIAVIPNVKTFKKLGRVVRVVGLIGRKICLFLIHIYAISILSITKI